MTRCAHCGDRFELRSPGDRYCIRCERDVNAQIAADARRREPRTAGPAWLGRAKSLSGLPVGGRS